MFPQEHPSCKTVSQGEEIEHWPPFQNSQRTALGIQLHIGDQSETKFKCLDRVATAQGKQGIWMFIITDRENTENVPKIIKIRFYTGIYLQPGGKFGSFKN